MKTKAFTILLLVMTFFPNCATQSLKLTVTRPAEVNLKDERVKYWMGQGALPTGTVKNLLKKQGI